MKKDKILLDIHSRRLADKMNDGKNIGKKMKANGNAEIIDRGTQLLNTSNALKAKLLERNALQNKVKGLTNQLNKLENNWNDDYKAAVNKAQEIYPNDAPVWKGYGFNLADTEPTERPVPPKVTGLTVTQGDEAGEGDLSWDPQPQKTINGYFIEVNPTDPIDPGAWVSARPRSVSASKVTVAGLKTGQKYWVRIIAHVTKGEGAPSDPVAFIAP